MAAIVDDFRLFLCHLYFAAHDSCIPYQVAADVDLTAVPAPELSIDCARFVKWRQLFAATFTSFFQQPATAIY